MFFSSLAQFLYKFTHIKVTYTYCTVLYVKKVNILPVLRIRIRIRIHRIHMFLVLPDPDPDPAPDPDPSIIMQK
jgi:hypothetical protein